MDLLHPHDPTTVLFAQNELACPHCGQHRLAPGFASALTALRLAFGRPMYVSSCCRCRAHNDSLRPRGHSRSLHLLDDTGRTTAGTCAIDIAHIPDSGYAHRLGMLAMQDAWSIGRISKTAMHLDRRHDHGMPLAFFAY